VSTNIVSKSLSLAFMDHCAVLAANLETRYCIKEIL